MSLPMHTNPLCRIWHLPKGGQPIHCSMSKQSLFFRVSTKKDNDDDSFTERVQWMPTISEELVECIDTDSYLVEILRGDGMAATTTPPCSSSSVTTNVGTKLLFQNDYINVWDFCTPAGQTSHLHRHTHSYVFINLVQSFTRGIDQNGQYTTQATTQEAGQTTFVAINQEAIHAAENVGDQEFQQVVIEFKRQPIA